MKNLGSAKQILGMSIIRDKTKGTLRLSQEKYIRKVLEKFNMKDADARCQPLGEHFKLNKKQSPMSEASRRRISMVSYALAVDSVLGYEDWTGAVTDINEDGLCEKPEKDLGSLACIKADKKKLDDIRVVRDFPEVFPDDLLGLPHVREVEFRIDLILGASPVVRSPYRLAPSEMLELSNQLKELQRNDNVVNRDGIHVDPSKVESVKNWKTLESPTEIRSFLGLAGYYRSFPHSKGNYANAPVLAALPDEPERLCVYCDASSKQGFRVYADAAGAK
ncbi:hypothetical protein Tco_0644690 [Tanacetum coccineum]